MWAWFTSMLLLAGGLGLIAWLRKEDLADAYETFAMGVVGLTSGFLGFRIWEKIGLAKQGYMPTPEGSAPAPKPATSSVKDLPKP